MMGSSGAIWVSVPSFVMISLSDGDYFGSFIRVGFMLVFGDERLGSSRNFQERHAIKRERTVYRITGSMIT